MSRIMTNGSRPPLCNELVASLFAGNGPGGFKGALAQLVGALNPQASSSPDAWASGRGEIHCRRPAVRCHQIEYPCRPCSSPDFPPTHRPLASRITRKVLERRAAAAEIERSGLILSRQPAAGKVVHSLREQTCRHTECAGYAYQPRMEWMLAWGASFRLIRREREEEP